MVFPLPEFLRRLYQYDRQFNDGRDITTKQKRGIPVRSWPERAGTRPTALPSRKHVNQRSSRCWIHRHDDSRRSIELQTYDRLGRSVCRNGRVRWTNRIHVCPLSRMWYWGPHERPYTRHSPSGCSYQWATAVMGPHSRSAQSVV